MYCSKSDVESIFSPSDVAKWATLGNDGSPTAISLRVNRAIAWATNEIEDILRDGRYPFPITRLGYERVELFRVTLSEGDWWFILLDEHGAPNYFTQVGDFVVNGGKLVHADSGFTLFNGSVGGAVVPDPYLESDLLLDPVTATISVNGEALFYLYAAKFTSSSEPPIEPVLRKVEGFDSIYELVEWEGSVDISKVGSSNWATATQTIFPDATPFTIRDLCATLAGVYLYEARGVQDATEEGIPIHRLRHNKDRCYSALRDINQGRRRLDAEVRVTSTCPQIPRRRYHDRHHG